MNRRAFFATLVAVALASWRRITAPPPPPSLSMDDLMEKYLRPAVLAINEKVEADLLDFYYENNLATGAGWLALDDQRTLHSGGLTFHPVAFTLDTDCL